MANGFKREIIGIQFSEREELIGKNKAKEC
jgi:hypothetical protein